MTVGEIFLRSTKDPHELLNNFCCCRKLTFMKHIYWQFDSMVQVSTYMFNQGET